MASPKEKPPRSCSSPGAFRLVGLAVLVESVKPLADIMCNGDDRRQWRKQGGAVGAAASRMRAAAKQTLGAATRAVAPKVTERALVNFLCKA